MFFPRLSITWDNFNWKLSHMFYKLDPLSFTYAMSLCVIENLSWSFLNSIIMTLPFVSLSSNSTTCLGSQLINNSCKNNTCPFQHPKIKNGCGWQTFGLDRLHTFCQGLIHQCKKTLFNNFPKWEHHYWAQIVC